MAKGKEAPSMAPDPDHDEYQTREDVHNLMRTDELHQDPKRLSRAVHRLHSTAARFGGKKKSGRKSGRSTAR